MTSCKDAYLKTGFELSVLQLLKANAEIIVPLQVLQEEEAFGLKLFEKLLAVRKEEKVAA